MKIIDRGGGTPVVVIPGIQGRWEWMKPAIDALAERCRVITFSLADEPSCGGEFDEERGFWNYVDQVGAALDAAGIRRAAICGVSYGGLIAAAFATRHADRVSSLILVSAVPPSWAPDKRVAFYLRAPLLLTPLFLLASLRLYREIAAARRGVVRGASAGARHACRVLTHMFSPHRMARRVSWLASARMADELQAVHQPTLIITGEPELDRVVPVASTRQYERICRDARVETLARTGHLGLITRPKEFAALVVHFADQAAQDLLREDVSAEPVRQIPGPVGPLEVLLDVPAGPPRAAVIFAHPLPTQGGTMHTKVVFQAAKALARIGCVVLRFNFRGVGRSAGEWDDGRGELDDFRAAVAFMAGEYPELELWAAGFSFGAYVAATAGADDERVCALIAVAPPVDRYEFAALKTSTKPTFIVHGERDELISLKLVRHFYSQLPEPKELVEIDRANHLFEGQASEVGDALVELLEDFSCRTL